MKVVNETREAVKRETESTDRAIEVRTYESYGPKMKIRLADGITNLQVKVLLAM